MGKKSSFRSDTKATRRSVTGTLLIGIMAGALSGLFGVGGGILIVPGLVLVLHMRQRSAHATSLAAIVPIAGSGVAGYALEGSVDWSAAAWLTFGAALGAVVGARALHRLPEQTLRRTFAAFVLLSAVAFLLHLSEGAGRGDIGPALAVGLAGVGVVSGVLAGLLGVGGGILIVPALVLLFAIPNAIAKGTSLLVIIPTAVVGTVQNVQRRSVDLRAAAWVGLGGVVSSFGASLVSVGLDPRLSSILFALLLALVAIRLIVPRERERGNLHR